MALDSSTNAYSRSAAPAESLKLVRSDTLSTAELIDELQKLDTVEFAEPNYIYTVSEGTKDLTGMQWAYDKNGDFSMYQFTHSAVLRIIHHRNLIVDKNASFLP